MIKNEPIASANVEVKKEPSGTISNELLELKKKILEMKHENEWISILTKKSDEMMTM